MIAFCRSSIRFALHVALGLIGSMVFTTPARAQVPFEVVHAFPVLPHGPTSLIQGADGFLYGVASSGSGPSTGPIFRIAPDGAVNFLSGFPAATLKEPTLTLRATDGHFYGIAYLRSASPSQSVIFRMSPDGAVTIVHAFPVGPYGSHAKLLLQANDGSFYGTVRRAGCGQVFRMTPEGDVTELRVDIAEGIPSPGLCGDVTGLVQSTDGIFYGATVYGYPQLPDHAGGIFRMTPTGVVTWLHVFTGDLLRPGDLGNPYGFLQAPDGSFYGTTHYGGSYGVGAAFRMTADGAVTVLHSFGPNAGEQGLPGRLIQGSDGSFYGLTGGNGFSGFGSVFKMTADGTVTTLHTFRGWESGEADGDYPIGFLQGQDGMLYGSTYSGGTANDGMLFRISTDGVFRSLHSFVAYPQGSGFYGGLTRASDGSYYGTASSGGTFNRGTVFRMTPGGTVNVVHMFTGGVDGARPYAGLLQARDGHFYGTTAGGGSGSGTIFRISPAGAMSVLHAFPLGGTPLGTLIQAVDGHLYGTTHSGGPAALGTVFRATLSGVVTTIHTFSGPDGAYPIAGLVQGTGGSLYGTTFGTGFQGGSGAYPSTVFRVAPDGSVTTLHTFTSSEGTNPYGGLVQASNGSLYGTTTGYVGGGPRSVFRITPAGAVSVLYRIGPEYSCDYSCSFRPISSLLLASDGNLYWVIAGVEGLSYALRMTPEGTLGVVHEFATNYVDVRGSLVQGTDNNLYGVGTIPSYDGLTAGTVFRFLTGASAPTQVTTATSRAGVRLSWTPVGSATSYTVKRGGLPGREDVIAKGITSSSFTDATVVPGARYYYVVTATNALGESVASHEVSITTGRAAPGDFEGDGKADVTVFRPSDGIWYTRQSSTGATAGVQWGSGSDVPVPGDYDGDGMIDIAVFRLSEGTWFIRFSATGTTVGIQWGNGGDKPVPGDYDGDGKTDIAIFRPSDGTWYLRYSGTGTTAGVAWGNSQDVPAPADYDGDGRTDITVFRPSDGIWYTLNSGSGTVSGVQWGSGSDEPVPGDYDGDGKADIAVFRLSNGVWYLRYSATGSTAGVPWGNGADVPVPGDYDGDGKTDIAVFRPSNGTWYLLYSATGTSAGVQWGNGSDVPILKRP